MPFYRKYDYDSVESIVMVKGVRKEEAFYWGVVISRMK